jgi:hypothetical protein
MSVAEHSSVLSGLTKKRVEFQWGCPQQSASKNIKQNTPVCQPIEYDDPDPSSARLIRGSDEPIAISPTRAAQSSMHNDLIEVEPNLTTNHKISNHLVSA